MVTGKFKARVRGYTCFLPGSLFQPATAASARERLVHRYTTGLRRRMLTQQEVQRGAVTLQQRDASNPIRQEHTEDKEVQMPGIKHSCGGRLVSLRQTFAPG